MKTYNLTYKEIQQKEQIQYGRFLVIVIVSILAIVGIVLSFNNKDVEIEQEKTKQKEIEQIIEKPLEAEVGNDLTGNTLVYSPKIDLSKVYNFVESYPNSQYTREYIGIIADKCNDLKAVKSVVAVATAETGQGKTTPLIYNFYGWHYNGNRYHDPDIETMSEQICKGVVEYGYFETLEAVKLYTGNDNPVTWWGIYKWAIAQM